KKTGAQQATAMRESDITTAATTAPATQHGFPTEPNTGATSARATAEVPENSPSRMEAPPSQAAERALLPGSTPALSQQNATDASRSSNSRTAASADRHGDAPSPGRS